jgi:hypothetical protein
MAVYNSMDCPSCKGARWRIFKWRGWLFHRAADCPGLPTCDGALEQRDEVERDAATPAGESDRG